VVKMRNENVDVLIVGASLAASAAAKRLVDAGLEVVALERRTIPRDKVCSGILSPADTVSLLRTSGRFQQRRSMLLPPAAA